MKALLAVALFALVSGCAANDNAAHAPVYGGVVCFVEQNGKPPTQWGLAKVKFQYDAAHDQLVLRDSKVLAYGDRQCLVIH